MKLRNKKLLRLWVVSNCMLIFILGFTISNGKEVKAAALENISTQNQESQLTDNSTVTENKEEPNKEESKKEESQNNTSPIENQPAIPEQLSYQGKKILLLGDSITAYGQWVSRFKEITKPDTLVSVAVAGATISDNIGTKYNGNPSSKAKKNNTLGNQVEKIKNKKKQKIKSYQEFDSIIIFAGTNDSLSKFKNVDIEKQFTTTKSKYKSLNSADKKTIAGSMRYIVETLQTLYPNAQIFICTTIQSAEDIKGYRSNYYIKNTVLKEIAYRLSVPVIDVGECGIYGRYEVKGSEGKYLYDGLHPNSKGGKLLGEYIVRKYIEWYAF